MVGLPVNLLDRFPHQLSGGQKARVRHRPRYRAAPETRDSRRADAASMFGKAVVLNLLQDLKRSMGMSYLFVVARF